MPDIRYEFKPRVNAALMSRFQNKTVLLVGQVLPSQQPGIGLLRAPDGQTVTVQLAPGSTFQHDFVEVEGTVLGQNRLQEASHHEIYEAVGESRLVQDTHLGLVHSRSGPWAGYCADTSESCTKWLTCMGVMAADMGVANEMCKISNMDFPGLFS